MNLLSTLVLIPLLNPLLSYGGTEGESTGELEDKGVNCNKTKNPSKEVNEVNCCNN
jgi:hypothetical protein